MPVSRLAEISVHIVPGRRGVWTVRGLDGSAAASVHASATEAERAAHGYAHAHGATQVVLHDRYARLHVAREQALIAADFVRADTLVVSGMVRETIAAAH